MARHPALALRVPARELLREPGARRDVRVSLAPEALGLADDRITGPIEVEVCAVSSVDSVTVTGTVGVPWSAPCRRCLRDVEGRVEVDVEEVYREGAGPDDDAYPLEGDQIDLVTPVREYVLIELPTDPLCRAACAGLCPVCGADRNDAPCDCDTTVRDERWAVLDELRPDE